MTKLNSDWTELIKEATKALKYAYAPYSNYQVGAALLSYSGAIFRGCNIENVAYNPSICAERIAIFKAVSEGERKFKAIAIVTTNSGTPCGPCRQVMREFSPNLTVITANLSGNWQSYTLSELLPHSFGPENLKQGI